MVFGLLELLFGGTFLGGKLVAESIGKSSTRAKHLDSVYIEHTLEDMGFEDDLMKQVHKNKIPWVIEQIPKSDLRYVFGEDWENLIKTYYKENLNSFKNADWSSPVHNFADISSVLFNMLMSQYGHIRWGRYLFGYQRGLDIKGVPHEQRFDVAVRACKVIDRNIRKEYPNFDIYLCQDPFRPNNFAWNTKLLVSGIRTTPYFS